MARLVFEAAGRSGGRRSSAPRRPVVRRRFKVAAGYALCAALALAAFVIARGELPEAPADAVPGSSVGAPVRVIDGDTIDVAGERVRLVNIDTPEMPPKARCAAEADGALRARDRLQALVASGDVALARTGTDRYGRTLAHVSVDGADVGHALIAAGLARPWEGRRRTWCA